MNSMIFEIVSFSILTCIALFSLTKIDWKKRKNGIFKYIPRNYVVLIFMIIGLCLGIYGLMKKEAKEYKHDIKSDEIKVLSQQGIEETKNALDILMQDYQNKFDKITDDFQSKSKTILNTVLSNSDSALQSKISAIRQSYIKMEKDYIIEKEISHRYYFSEEWPFSDKVLNISGDMFFFIPIDISGQVDGIDRYIVWTLIKNKGTYPYNKIDSLQDEIWDYLKPMKLGLGINLEKLKTFNVIKPDYWKSNNIEFTDEFMERLKVYQAYKDTDEYVPKLFEVYRKYRVK
ncbi:hypothetical protein HZA73_01835 [candidate division TA06 bacterium]|nr:hypothetical protein [candidate division TA06 bacterium]